MHDTLLSFGINASFGTTQGVRCSRFWTEDYVAFCHGQGATRQKFHCGSVESVSQSEREIFFLSHCCAGPSSDTLAHFPDASELPFLQVQTFHDCRTGTRVETRKWSKGEVEQREKEAGMVVVNCLSLPCTILKEISFPVAQATCPQVIFCIFTAHPPSIFTVPFLCARVQKSWAIIQYH